MRDSAVTLFGIMVPQSGAPSCDTMMVAWPVLALHDFEQHSDGVR